MSTLAYRLEDSFSAAAAQHKNVALGRVLSACAVAFALIGDTLRPLDGSHIR